jgi:hypothetical protein
MGRGGRFLSTALLVFIATFSLLGTHVAAAQAASDPFNGTWQCCGAGGASEQVFVINGNTGIGYTSIGGSEFATITASFNYPKLQIVTTYVNSSYVATFNGVISPNGKTESGSWFSNANQSGTWTATKSGPGVAGPPTTKAPSGLGLKAAAAPIASSIGTPGEVFHSMGHNLVNAGITVAVLLFITFPATIFNNTFSSNYGEILLMIASFRRRVRRAFGLKDRVLVAAPSNLPAVKENADEPGRTGRLGFLGVLVLGSILGGLLDPKFGLNRQSATDLGATFVSFAIGALFSWYITKVFRQHHKYPTSTYLRALPFGLAVAVLCVLISRFTHFEPGYLYGVVVGIAFAESLEERHNAHLTVISTFSTLAVALIAWFIWVPVNHIALNHVGNVPIGLVDDVLGSIFVGGLVGTVVGLMPLSMMPGGTLLRWRKDVWVVVFFIAVFLLVEIELNPASGPTHHGSAPVVTALVLFVGFGGATLWMRYFFAQRAKAKGTTPALAAGSIPPTSVANPAGRISAPSALEPGEVDDPQLDEFDDT